MSRDRAAERELRGFLDGLETDGPVLYDLAGTAVYQLEPSWRSVVLCGPCRFLNLVLSIPRRPFVYECPRCGKRQRLHPPLEVLAAKAPDAGTDHRLARPS